MLSSSASHPEAESGVIVQARQRRGDLNWSRVVKYESGRTRYDHLVNRGRLGDHYGETRRHVFEDHVGKALPLREKYPDLALTQK